MTVHYRADVSDHGLHVVRPRGLGDRIPSVGEQGAGHPLDGVAVQASAPLSVRVAYVLDQLQDLEVEGVRIGVLAGRDAVIRLSTGRFPYAHRCITGHIGCYGRQFGGPRDPAVGVRRLGADILACEGAEELGKGPFRDAGPSARRGAGHDRGGPVAHGGRGERLEGRLAPLPAVLWIGSDYGAERRQPQPHLDPPGIPARILRRPSSI